jgi:hypothetical protein
MRWPRRGVVMILAACAAASGALVSCSETPARQQQRTANRRVLDVQWRERWRIGGGEGDTTVLMPSYVVGDQERVYVLEGQLHRVVALRADDGTVAWIAGGEGSGPQELRRPTGITMDGRGNVLVMDQGNGRVAVLAPSGTFTSHVPLQELGFPLGLCALRDGSMLVAAVATDHPLVRVSPRGKVIERYDLPWKELRDAGSLSVQGDLESDGHGGCIYALSKGRGFVTFVEDRLTAREYVEWFDVPPSQSIGDAYAGGRRETLAEGPTAAQGVGVGKEGIAVGFSGRTDDAGRLIDLYDARTGAYTRTYRAPRWFERMSRAGDLYVFITRIDGYPALLAAEPIVEPS